MDYNCWIIAIVMGDYKEVLIITVGSTLTSLRTSIRICVGIGNVATRPTGRCPDRFHC